MRKLTEILDSFSLTVTENFIDAIPNSHPLSITDIDQQFHAVSNNRLIEKIANHTDPMNFADYPNSSSITDHSNVLPRA